MEYEDLVIYGAPFKYSDIPKNCEAYKIFLDSGTIKNEADDFLDFFLGDFFGDFYFGFHEPTKQCYLSLGEIHGETNLGDLDVSKINNKKVDKDFVKWMEFFGQFNKSVGWHFLSNTQYDKKQ